MKKVLLLLLTISMMVLFFCLASVTAGNGGTTGDTQSGDVHAVQVDGNTSYYYLDATVCMTRYVITCSDGTIIRKDVKEGDDLTVEGNMHGWNYIYSNDPDTPPSEITIGPEEIASVIAGEGFPETAAEITSNPPTVEYRMQVIALIGIYNPRSMGGGIQYYTIPELLDKNDSDTFFNKCVGVVPANVGNQYDKKDQNPWESIYYNKVPTFRLDVQYIDIKTNELLEETVEEGHKGKDKVYPVNYVIPSIGDYKLIEDNVVIDGINCTISTLPEVVITNSDKDFYFYYKKSTPTPTPVITKEKPPKEEIKPYESSKDGYALNFYQYAPCSKQISGDIKIFDNVFGVLNGNPIPTSELLKIRIKNNYIAKINGIEIWKLTVTDPKPYTFYGEYIKGYYVSHTSYSYTYSGDQRIEKIEDETPYGEYDNYVDAVGDNRYFYLSDDYTYDEYGRLIAKTAYSVNRDSESYEPVVYTPTSEQLGSLDYTVTKKANISQYLKGIVTNRALGPNGKAEFFINPGYSVNIKKKSDREGNDPTRVKPNNYLAKSEDFFPDSTITFTEWVEKEEKALTVASYYGVEGDPDITVSINGVERKYPSNCLILKDDKNENNQYDSLYGGQHLYTLDISDVWIIPEIPNCSDGVSYPSTGRFEYEGGSLELKKGTVNSVRVHTPIHNEIQVNQTSKNQLENASLANGCKVVTLGDSFSASVKLYGRSHYYSSITSKYVKEVRIHCDLCGYDYVATSGFSDTYNHSCTVSPFLEDGTIHYFTSTVVAKNIGTGGADGVQTAIYNTPDGYYQITQSVPVFIAGKMFDFEVRTTDDPGWKLKTAEKLSKLPIGEFGDNFNTAYKSAIKLGYRAYFDLKTLGTSSKAIRITPKLLYVDLNGNVFDENAVQFWYKISATSYKKLSASDIVINMNMSSTKGDVNNDVNFLTERAEMIKRQSVNYNKTLNIGGLNGMTLTKDNSTITKYNGSFIDNAKRWYGEVYVPSSTMVLKAGSNVKDKDAVTMINSGKAEKNGFILLVFDKIETVMSDDGNGVSYLEYSIAKNPGLSNVPPYILLNEKQTTVEPKGTIEGLTVKNNVNLPNNKRLANNFSEEDLKTDAPIIIYDISLKANNDYETSGTH